MTDFSAESKCVYSESDGCTGVMAYATHDGGCTCFLGAPPCGVCTSNKVVCTVCGESVDPDDERDMYAIGVYNFLLDSHPGHPRGLTAKAVCAMTNAEMEAAHDWVQWAFPLPERSQAVAGAPYVSARILVEWSKDHRIRRSMIDLSARYLKFLRTTKDWHSPGDHNQLRITRMLKSMKIILGDPAAMMVYDVLVGKVAPKGSTVPEHMKRPLRYWFDAVA